MKLYLLLTCLCSSLFGLAQPAFNKTFGLTNYGGNGASVVVLNDSSYLVAGRASDPFPFKINTLLARVDKFGDTVFTKMLVLPADTSWEAQTMLRESDSLYVVHGTLVRFLPNEERQTWIAKINLDGDTLWTLNIGSDTLQDNSSRMIHDSRGDYVCSGWSYELDDEDEERILLTKVSSEGELLFEKRYPEVINGYQHYLGFSLTQVNDGGYVIVGGKYPDASPFAPGYDVYYFKVDSDGSQLWTKQISNIDWDAATDVLASSNNGFAMCGYKSYQVGALAFHQKLWLGRFDEDGNLIDQSEYTDGSEIYVSPSRMIRVSDGGYVIVGAMDSLYNHKKAFVVKFDSLLDFKWARFYKRGYNDVVSLDLFSDVAETLDRGLIACGRTVEAMPDTAQNVWLVKMDSLGCDVPGCDTLDTAVQPLLAAGEFAVVAFPNPAKDKVYFKYRLPSGVNKAEIVLSDASGKEAKRLTVSSYAGVTSCNPLGLVSGLYVVTLRTSDGNAVSCKLIVE